MDLYREVSRVNLKKDLEHVRRYLLQLTAAHVCPRNDVIFQNDVFIPCSSHLSVGLWLRNV